MSDDRETANCSFTDITHISEKICMCYLRLKEVKIASTSCIRSNIATTKQKTIIKKYNRIPTLYLLLSVLHTNHTFVFLHTVGTELQMLQLNPSNHRNAVKSATQELLLPCCGIS